MSFARRGVRRWLAVGVVAASGLAVGSCSSGSDAPADGGSALTAPGDSTGADPACAAPGNLPVGEQTMEVDGAERTYVVHVPPGYDGTAPAPLILSFHGFGGDIAEQDSTTDLPAQAGDRGYVVVTPQALGITIPEDSPVGDQADDLAGFAFWNIFGSSDVDFGAGNTLPVSGGDLGADDVAFVDQLLDRLEADLCIDAERIYSTGMSNGAGMTTTLVCELGDRLDGAAPVSGVNLTGACAGDDVVPVRAFHGDEDDVAAFEGNNLYGFELGNPSVTERMTAWREQAGCEPAPDTVEDATVTIFTWEGCVDDALVQLWVIHGGGHTWPRGTEPDGPLSLDATALVLDFFDSQA